MAAKKLGGKKPLHAPKGVIEGGQFIGRSSVLHGLVRLLSGGRIKGTQGPPPGSGTADPRTGGLHRPRLRDAMAPPGEPVAGKDRERLRKMAKDQGVAVPRGAQSDEIEALLQRHAQRPPPLKKPAPPPPLAIGSALGAHLGKLLDEGVPEHARGDLRDELAAQASLTPRTAARLRGVWLPEFKTKAADTYRAAKAGTLAFYYRLGPEIFLHPSWDRPGRPGEQAGVANFVLRIKATSDWFAPSTGTPMRSIFAHEYGHHVAEQFMNGLGIDDDAAQRLLPMLARLMDIDVSALLAEPAPIKERRLNDWVAENGTAIRAMVSAYGITSFAEMLAEIWSEYSTMGPDARPHIREIGELMRELAERSEDPS